jgi:hypothetical protein
LFNLMLRMRDSTIRSGSSGVIHMTMLFGLRATALMIEHRLARVRLACNDHALALLQPASEGVVYGVYP